MAATESPSLSGKTPKSSTAFLANLTEELKRKYPEPKMGDLEADGVKRALKRLVMLHGEDKLKTAVQRCLIENPNYGKFPTIGQIEERVPQVKLRAVTDKNCSDCEGSGWKLVYEGFTTKGNPIDPKVGAVRRCHCWRKESA